MSMLATTTVCLFVKSHHHWLSKTIRFEATGSDTAVTQVLSHEAHDPLDPRQFVSSSQTDHSRDFIRLRLAHIVVTLRLNRRRPQHLRSDFERGYLN
jgi:hypothetical protein